MTAPTPADNTSSATSRHPLKRVVIRFAGDSGDGMQLTGSRFTADTALLGNDLATLPNFPAEIRAPQGTLPGVSSFQIHFADHDIFTPGGQPDVLVAMNPAAFKANIADLKTGGVLIANSDEFSKRNLTKVGYDATPLDDAELNESYTIHALNLTTMTTEALADVNVSRKDAARAKNMFALGLVSWLYSRPIESTIDFLNAKFAKDPDVLAANLTALKAGWAFGETSETFAHQYEVAAAPSATGTYRNITGNTALAYGLTAAGHKAKLPIVLGSYPITPASDILHSLSKLKKFNVTTIQAEDEIAAVGAALGASYGGALGVTTTSGPGLALKAETIGLAVMQELPLVIVNVQRGGPSTGLPTKTEQADLNQALHGRNGESPLPVIAAQSPTDCFDAAVDAVRVAVTYRTPVILLTDGYIANGAEPWKVPTMDTIAPISPDFATSADAENFQPYTRDPETLARPWAIPGTAGLEHRIGGLEKADGSGDISYDPDNHHKMVTLRNQKVQGVSVPDIVVDDPTGDARLLVVGWGSTYGPITAGVNRVRDEGLSIAQTHLRFLNPLPANLGEVLESYDRVILPEMNLGQLRSILRDKYLVDIAGYNMVRGLPFGPAELYDVFTRELNTLTTDSTPAGATR